MAWSWTTWNVDSRVETSQLKQLCACELDKLFRVSKVFQSLSNERQSCHESNYRENVPPTVLLCNPLVLFVQRRENLFFPFKLLFFHIRNESRENRWRNDEKATADVWVGMWKKEINKFLSYFSIRMFALRLLCRATFLALSFSFSISCCCRLTWEIRFLIISVTSRDVEIFQLGCFDLSARFIRGVNFPARLSSRKWSEWLWQREKEIFRATKSFRCFFSRQKYRN